MSVKEIMSVAIKLMAMWLMIEVVIHLPTLILFLGSIEQMHGEGFQSSFYVIVSVLFLVIGAVASIVLFKISNSVLGEMPNPSDSDPILVTERFIIQLAGVYFIVSALKVFPSLAFKTNLTAGEFNLDYVIIFGGFFELSVGCYMLISSKAWCKWIAYFRGREY